MTLDLAIYSYNTGNKSNQTKKIAAGMAQVAECLPSKCKALSPKPQYSQQQ
jgi:hypothetical protein